VESPAEKAALRRHYRNLRFQFAAQQGRATRAQLGANMARLLEDLDLAQDVPICLYRPMSDEADFDLKPTTRFYFPKMFGEDLEFWRPLQEDCFAPNSYGISEPVMDESVPLRPEGDADLVIFCPAVAVDEQGHRLGMGQGYYDRFFARHPHAVRVGVVFDVQVSGRPLPAEQWDQMLDWIVTEKRVLRTMRSR